MESMFRGEMDGVAVEEVLNAMGSAAEEVMSLITGSAMRYSTRDAQTKMGYAIAVSMSLSRSDQDASGDQE